MVPLWASVWCESYTRGFAEAFARWGYLGDGLVAVPIGGWCYVGFRPLADPGLVPVRIARAAQAAADDEHLHAARDWAEVTGPGFERQLRRLATGAGPGRLEGAVRLVREVVRARFATTCGVQELVVEWVLQAGERLGWSPERALALAAGPPRVVAELRGVLQAVQACPALAARLDRGESPALDELRADPGVAAALAAHLDRRGDTLLQVDLAGPTLAERPEHLAGAVAAAWSPFRRPPAARSAEEALLDADLRAALERAPTRSATTAATYSPAAWACCAGPRWRPARSWACPRRRTRCCSPPRSWCRRSAAAASTRSRSSSGAPPTGTPSRTRRPRPSATRPVPGRTPRGCPPRPRVRCSVSARPSP